MSEPETMLEQIRDEQHQARELKWKTTRDPEDSCQAYVPGVPGGDCESDGHYMCDECETRAAPMQVPAITLWQPWASWIAHGLKTIETRKHPGLASLAGKRIAIHASARKPKREDMISAWEWIPLVTLKAIETPRGAVVAMATVKEHRQLSKLDERASLCACDGLWGLVLVDVQRIIELVSVKGHQGIWYWEVPPDAQHLVEVGL